MLFAKNMDETGITIESAFGDYAPRMRFVPLVRRMLGVVPEACLDGITSIELRVSSEGNRAQRRKKRRQQGREYRKKDVLGSYIRQGPAPYIILYVDNLDRQNENFPRVPVLTRFATESNLAETLFHEIGHHIHLSKMRSNGAPENVADDWAEFYIRRYLKRRFWWFRLILLPYFASRLAIDKITRGERYKRRIRRRAKTRRLRQIEAELVAAYERTKLRST